MRSPRRARGESDGLPWVPIASLHDYNFSAHRPLAGGCPPPPQLCRLEDVFDEIIVFSLPRFASRATRIVSQLRALGTPFTLVHAFDARSVGWLSASWGGAQWMGAGSIALQLSHVVVADYIQRSPFRNALIWEDDATLANDFPRAFDAAARVLPPDWRFLHLGQSLERRDPSCVPATGPLVLLSQEPCVTQFWGAFATAIERSAWEMTNAAVQRSKVNIDTDAFHELVRHFANASYFSWPPLVAMNPFHGSTLGNSWPVSPADWMRANGVTADRFNLRGAGYTGAAAGSSAAPAACSRLETFFRGVELGPGHDISWREVNSGGAATESAAERNMHESEQACCAACAEVSAVCAAWTFRAEKGGCALKWSASGLLRDGVAVSGSSFAG